jgi:hypothetical protein
MGRETASIMKTTARVPEIKCPELRESWPGNTREMGLPQKNHIGIIEFSNKLRKNTSEL